MILIVTGGSMLATKRLVEQTGARVVGAPTIPKSYLNPEELNNIEIYKLKWGLVND